MEGRRHDLLLGDDRLGDQYAAVVHRASTARNGVFTCPVAGFYAMGYNGIHRGGSGIPAGFNTYGYAAFAKNGAMSYFVHWNQAADTYWNTGGTSALFSCAAGDTLALFVNRPPVSAAAGLHLAELRAVSQRAPLCVVQAGGVSDGI